MYQKVRCPTLKIIVYTSSYLTRLLLIKIKIKLSVKYLILFNGRTIFIHIQWLNFDIKIFIVRMYKIIYR